MEKLPQQIRDPGRQYARDIMACQAAGPHLTGGNCQGGRIAFAIALALIEAGPKIDVLFLMGLFLMRDYPGNQQAGAGS